MSSILLTKPVEKDYFFVYYFAFCFAVISLLLIARGCENTKIKKPNIYGARMGNEIVFDTTKPKYTINPSANYFRRIDTLNLIVDSYLGKALTVDQADQLKQIFFRITRELKIDTTWKIK